MNWATSGYNSGPTFAAQSGKSLKQVVLSGGLTNINLKEPLMNNTWCPIMSSPSPAPVSLTAPVMVSNKLLYDPDISVYTPQEVPFGAFTLNQTCPDQVLYYSTFLSDTSKEIPSFITFDPTNNKYWFNINSTSHVGVY